MANNKLNVSNNLLDNYSKWLRENMSAYTFSSGVVELTVPFLDSSNDYVQIYLVQNDDNSYTLTDDGHTIFNLSLQGVSIKSPKRKDILNRVCNNYGVELANNALTIKTNSATLPQSKHRLIQAIQAVSDMSVLSQKSITSMFVDDVAGFLDDNNVPYIPNVEILGKSGYSHHVDFSIPKKGEPDIFLNAKNRMDKSMSQLEIFSVLETREFRKEAFRAIVLIDDSNKSIQDSAVNALESYGIRSYYWSDKDIFLEVLK